MKTRARFPLALAALVTLACAATTAHAVTFYTTLAAFQAVSTTTLESTFESLAGAQTASPIVQGRVTYASTISSLPFYVLKPGNPGDVCCTFPHVTSTYLCGNGNEDWDMTFAPPAVSAVGFDVTTNNTGVTITVFDEFNNQIGTTTITAHNVATFSGVTSSVPIGRMHFYSQNLSPPNAQNSAIDNVRIGVAASTPVLPATWGSVKTLYR